MNATAHDFHDKLTGFDCTDYGSDQTVVSLLNTENCKLNEANITYSIVDVQIVQAQVYDKRSYRQCYVSYNVAINRCGRWGGRNTHMKSYSYILEMTQATCEEMHRYKIYEDKSINHLKIQIKDNVGYYNNIVKGSLEKNGDCDGSTFVDHHGEKFERVYVRYEIRITTTTGYADLNLETQNMILENGIKCNYMDGNCFDVTNGYTFWNIGIPSDYCDSKKPLFLIYRGPVNKTVEYGDDNSTKISYFNYDQDRLFFIDAQKKTRICGFDAFVSQHPNIFITEVMEHHGKFKRDTNFNIKNIDTLILHGMQLSMMYNDIATQMSRLYNHIQFQKCLSDSKIIAATLAIAQIDPNSLGLSIFGKPGFFTKISGEVAYILKCKPHEVSFRKTPNCYNEIPIMHNEKPKFLAPRSRLIVEVGTEISCDDFFQPIFSYNDLWFKRFNGRFEETKTPTTIKIETFKKWSFKPLEGISHRGLYSKEDMENYKKSVNEPLNFHAIERHFMHQVQATNDNGRPSFSISNLIDEKEYEKIFKFDEWSKHFFSSVYGKFIALGNIFSALMAIFCIFGVIKFFLNWLINGYALYRVFGFTWRILFGFWDAIVQIFIRSFNTLDQQMNLAGTEMNVLREIETNETEMKEESVQYEKIGIFSGRPLESSLIVPNAPNFNRYAEV